MPEENVSKLETPEGVIENLRKEQELSSWSAKEFHKREIDPWKISMLILAGVVIVIYAIVTANYLFALIAVMTGVVVQIFLKKEPAEIFIQITNLGVKVDGKEFTFEDDLNSFWVLYNPPEVKTLNFDRKQALLPGLTLQLEDENPIKLREILLRYLPENTEKEEDISERTARRLGI